jgi:hypothetical protein
MNAIGRALAGAFLSATLVGLALAEEAKLAPRVIRAATVRERFPPRSGRSVTVAALLLGCIHDDEPDLTQQVSDAEVEPAKHLKINRSTPLWKLLDGDLTSWSVLDPLEGASLTIKLKKPVTVESLAVSATSPTSGSRPTRSSACPRRTARPSARSTSRSPA